MVTFYYVAYGEEKSEVFENITEALDVMNDHFSGGHSCAQVVVDVKGNACYFPMSPVLMERSINRVRGEEFMKQFKDFDKVM